MNTRAQVEFQKKSWELQGKALGIAMADAATAVVPPLDTPGPSLHVLIKLLAPLFV